MGVRPVPLLSLGSRQWPDRLPALLESLGIADYDLRHPFLNLGDAMAIYLISYDLHYESEVAYINLEGQIKKLGTAVRVLLSQWVLHTPTTTAQAVLAQLARSAPSIRRTIQAQRAVRRCASRYASSISRVTR